ncbi:hypothetical protein ABID22_000105 [Pontibacter aydingkolensis]|uniref:Tsp45I type II restriction enzyme n=1 Tax=Pontibacter aydingkolensis TaxID=1911536 RepID=A0ABS7CQX5_9BACT|nr:hypothetical protein [Pontibacter aydingkolensis]MBW7466225.1 hypothetical protein [Pontibacter aydingkolensis]
MTNTKNQVVSSTTKTNPWVDKSIKLAGADGYLDNLLAIYPMNPETEREIADAKVKKLKTLFDKKDSEGLITELLSLPLFPLKDSYVAYLKRCKPSIKRNPATINRLAQRLYIMGFDAMMAECSKPKETNRQIGPMFRNWLNTQTWVQMLDEHGVLASTTGIVGLQGSDAALLAFAETHLNYKIEKGLDFILKKDNTYVIGESKFLTDFGGHQNAQFNDAYNLVDNAKAIKAVSIAVLDGVVWIEANNKMHKKVKDSSYGIMSALLLGDFVASL